MKKFTLKIIALVFIMLFLIFCVPVVATNSKDKVILEKTDTEYLIYYKDILNQEFEFAFSTDKEEKETNLNFTKCAKDQAKDIASNIAYIDTTLYETYFKDKGQAYIWVRNQNDEIVIEADLIELEEALTEEQVEIVNTTTERIEVDTTQTTQTNEMLDGVDTTITKGKIVINGKENAKYSYLILEATNADSSAAELYSLAEQVKQATDTYQKLKLSKEFYDLYQKLLPTEKEWQPVNELTIMQPEDTVQGDKYVVYIKEETDKTTIDAKFLISVRKEEQGKAEIEKQITEIVSSPVTFDSGIILFILLVIIVVALLIFIIIRKKQDKENK